MIQQGNYTVVGDTEVTYSDNISDQNKLKIGSISVNGVSTDVHTKNIATSLISTGGNKDRFKIAIGDNETAIDIPVNLNGLENVATGNPSDGQVLTYDSTLSQWTSKNGGTTEPLIVTITVEDSPTDTGYAVGGDVDKTYDEIIEAINEGRNVYCFVKDDSDFYYTRNVCINDVVNYYDDGVLVYEAVKFVSFEFGDATINCFNISIERGDEGTQSSTIYRRYPFL